MRFRKFSDLLAQDDPKFDTLSGEPLLESGWILTRRLDGKEYPFKSLTGINEALAEGTFGVKFVQSRVLDTAPEFDAPAGGKTLGAIWIDEFTGGMNSPTCPEATCWGCPDPETCAELRTGDDAPFECECCEECAFEEDIMIELETGEKPDYDEMFGYGRAEPSGWDAPEFDLG